MRLLITGGAGYIGSHTLKQLLNEDHEILVYDSFVNSSPIALKRVQELTNRGFQTVKADLRDRPMLDQAMQTFKPDAVLHLAGLKAVGESVEMPLEYYSQNVTGTISLLQAMQKVDCKRIVFSSSATVYGDAEYLPYDEDHPLKPANPYGRTKLFVEEIIRDWAKALPGSSAILLRYFNPVGADASGRIGEDPRGVPNNLLPYIAQVAVGRFQQLSVFGDTYDTRDGTGERDYIHVEDLASAHLAAVNHVADHIGCEAVNVGTGQGVTVLELVRCFEKAIGRKIPYSVVEKRAGDTARAIAAVDKCARLLGWRAQFSLDQICESAWNWQVKNPNGYEAE